MTLTLDKMNRIVVPKALRNRFSLNPGDELEVRIDVDGIHLRPAVPASPLIEKDGVIVCSSEVPQSAWDLNVFIDDQRNRRANDLGGLE